jgi:thiamine biosynthesis protein ThiI
MDKKQKGLLLISGGIDSVVAGYLIAKKGFGFDAVHFKNYTDLDKIKSLLNIIKAMFGFNIKLYVIDHSIALEKIKQKTFPNFRCILCKRTMLKIADLIAIEQNYDFLINGDNLGQVASQTLSNLKSISNGIQTTIARPLLSFDKQEIINIAREIGSYKISTTKDLPCNYLPDNPKTRSRLEEIRREEKKLPQDILSEALENIKIIDI